MRFIIHAGRQHRENVHANRRAEMVAEPITRPQRITRARASRRDLRGRSVVTFPSAERAIDLSSLSLRKQIDTQFFF